MRIEKRQGLILSPKLEVRDLRVVIALGTVGTTAAAAELLHLTQSAVSRALAAAEDHAGTALFERTPRGLVPTVAGARLLEAAPAILAELRSLERRLREPEPRPQRVRLVAECHMAYPWLAKMVLALRKSAPVIQLEMPLEHSSVAAQALLEGQVDAAMLTSPVPRGFPSLALFEDELVFLVSRDHPLANAASLRPRDLAESVLLAPNARTEDAWFVRQVFGARPPRLTVQRLPVTEAIVELARAGLGVAILSEWVAKHHVESAAGGLTILRLATGPLRRSWRLAHQRELAPLVPCLVDAIVGAHPVSTLA